MDDILFETYNGMKGVCRIGDLEIITVGLLPLTRAVEIDTCHGTIKRGELKVVHAVVDGIGKYFIQKLDRRGNYCVRDAEKMESALERSAVVYGVRELDEDCGGGKR